MPVTTRFQFDSNNTSLYNKGQMGVFAEQPAMTPKYAINNGLPRDSEFRETMARMFISISNSAESKKNYLRSISGLGTEVNALAKVLLGDSSGARGRGTGYIDFLLVQAQEAFTEKVQTVEVLGDRYVSYFFGQTPPVFNYSAVLLNSYQDNQRVQMFYAYQNLLRGTEAAKQGSILRLRYDSVIVTGTLLGMSQILNADNELSVPFNFQLLVKEYQIATKPSPKDVSLMATPKVSTPADSGVRLTNVGDTSVVRVRTSMYVPPRSSGNSAAGADTANENASGVPAAQPNQQAPVTAPQTPAVEQKAVVESASNDQAARDEALINEDIRAKKPATPEYGTLPSGFGF